MSKILEIEFCAYAELYDTDDNDDDEESIDKFSRRDNRRRIKKSKFIEISDDLKHCYNERFFLINNPQPIEMSTN